MKPCYTPAAVPTKSADIFVGGFAHSADMCFVFTMCFQMFSHMRPSTCLALTYLTLYRSRALYDNDLCLCYCRIDGNAAPQQLKGNIPTCDLSWYTKLRLCLYPLAHIAHIYRASAVMLCIWKHKICSIKYICSFYSVFTVLSPLEYYNHIYM